MNAALKVDYVPVADYLEGEEISEVRHEYIGGVVFAMAGGSRDHNAIALNLVTALHAHLRNGKCRVSMADLKLRVLAEESDVFYYPDIMVTCDPRDIAAQFNQYPKVIIEILSESTERIDRIEKFDHYTKIETLEQYVLVAQDRTEVTIFSRATNWKPETFVETKQGIQLNSIGFSIPLAEVYQNVRG